MDEETCQPNAKKLQEEGFLEFDLIAYQDSKWINVKHIRMGIGFIEFIFSNKTVRYNHDEIKKCIFKMVHCLWNIKITRKNSLGS
ncbi:MAG: hypothetical protein HWD58_20705 [Bacteroidota bacterium]|nr:MAG: hypothetical protein HWD58_20705 [Bacteroidota bacterium]